ncbi:MAG: MBL fold metallo-hydrolase [Candidatus Colwellbacteria bacterium]|nr:MBL fold metallo-hydrolase [Candidatus Colwellbacteria bacterium]
MKLHFYGGAQSVTGANYLLEGNPNAKGKTTKILIDCGLTQGSREEEKQNYEPLPYDPKEVEALLITHAHIDHTGRVPFLYKSGFRGQIYSTSATKDFSEYLLIDSQGLLEKDARDHGHEVLYSLQDVSNALKIWTGVRYHEKLRINEFDVEFFDAGHILGSSFIRISAKDEKTGEVKTIVFSGDLGNVTTPLVKDTEMAEGADYVVMESLYGDKIHEPANTRKDKLEDAIEETVAAGGVLMIPAFAMERTQELLYEINELSENHRIPRVPIFIDSPLAIKLVAVYKKYSADPDYFDSEALALFKKGDEIFNFPGLKFTLTTEQSKEINSVPAPKVIIAGSGMSEGGRMIHHESRYISDPKSTLLFISYQSPYSLGRKIMNGEKMVRIFGEDVLVRCKTRSIGGYSAHADQLKLLNWIRPMRDTLKKIYLVQSEGDTAEIFRTKVMDELAIPVEVPKSAMEVEL